jgi:hypothetical protein
MFNERFAASAPQGEPSRVADAAPLVEAPKLAEGSKPVEAPKLAEAPKTVVAAKAAEAPKKDAASTQLALNIPAPPRPPETKSAEAKPPQTGGSVRDMAQRQGGGVDCFRREAKHGRKIVGQARTEFAVVVRIGGCQRHRQHSLDAQPKPDARRFAAL